MHDYRETRGKRYQPRYDGSVDERRRRDDLAQEADDLVVHPILVVSQRFVDGQHHRETGIPEVLFVKLTHRHPPQTRSEYHKEGHVMKGIRL